MKYSSDWEKSMYEHPKLMLDADIELTIDDLNYACRKFKGKKFIKYVKECAKRLKKTSLQLNNLENAIALAKVKAVKKMLNG